MHSLSGRTHPIKCGLRKNPLQRTDLKENHFATCRSTGFGSDGLRDGGPAAESRLPVDGLQPHRGAGKAPGAARSESCFLSAGGGERCRRNSCHGGGRQCFARDLAGRRRGAARRQARRDCHRVQHAFAGLGSRAGAGGQGARLRVPGCACDGKQTSGREWRASFSGGRRGGRC